MIKQLADSIASFLVHENVIENNDVDIYSYGAEQVLINFTTFLTVAIISSVFDIWVEAILFFIGLMPIRLVAGGYHANTPQRCNVLSLFVFIVNMLFIDLLEMFMTKEIVLAICFLILRMVFSYAPVDHKNRVLEAEDYIQAKRYSRYIVLVLVGICIGMAWVFENNLIIPLSIIMGALTASISLVLGHNIRKGEKNEKFAKECN